MSWQKILPTRPVAKREIRLNPTPTVSDQVVKCPFLVKPSFRITALKKHPYTLTVFFLLALQGQRKANIAFCSRFFQSLRLLLRILPSGTGYPSLMQRAKPSNRTYPGIQWDNKIPVHSALPRIRVCPQDACPAPCSLVAVKRGNISTSQTNCTQNWSH